MDKSQILDEVRRTADENGGTPFGFGRFASETGIRKSVWQNFWPRWSAVLSEAGFIPNELTRAHEKAALVEAYANLAAELGRLPTQDDMKFRRKNDSAFAGYASYRSHFGPHRSLIKELLEYCQVRNDLARVAEWCKQYIDRKRSSTTEGSAKSHSSGGAVGYVYLLRSGNHHKIGHTNAVGRRAYELGTQLPERATIVHFINTDDPAGIEAYWHKRYADKRQNGEWFKLDATDIAAFKRRKFM